MSVGKASMHGNAELAGHARSLGILTMAVRAVAGLRCT